MTISRTDTLWMMVFLPTSQQWYKFQLMHQSSKFVPGENHNLEEIIGKMSAVRFSSTVL